MSLSHWSERKEVNMSEKILINILSEQIIPNFVAIMHELPDKVISLVTEKFKKQSDLLEQLTGTPHQNVDCDAYNLMGNIKSLSATLVSIKPEDEIILNFTGGTKIMAISSVFSCLQLHRKIRMIYIDTEHKRLDILIQDENMKIIPAKEEALSLNIPFDAYIKLHGESLLDKQDNLELNNMCDKAIKMLLSENCDGFFGKQRCFKKDGKTFKEKGNVTFTASRRAKSHGSGSFIWENDKAVLTDTSGKSVTVTRNNIINFFTGKWLEEYCFNRLKQSGRFNEVLMNVKLSLSKETLEKLKNRKTIFKEKNEIDVVVTKGLKAALIECKAGKVTQDHIYKIDFLRKHLLGTFGYAVIVSRNPVDPIIQEKAESCNVEIVFGDKIKRLHKRIEDLFCYE